MELDETVNYIVSGLERSGTSMMMQILHAGGIPLAFDESRKPDDNNPKGYFELEGGKIINKLIEGTFPFDSYKGKFVKITAFGLKHLPSGNYKIVFMERNLEEVLDSMEKMAKLSDENREETKKSFQNLNEKVKREIQNRKDIDILTINYNDFLMDPKNNIMKICNFLKMENPDLQTMVGVIDKRLYRQRRELFSD